MFPSGFVDLQALLGPNVAPSANLITWTEPFARIREFRLLLGTSSWHYGFFVFSAVILVSALVVAFFFSSVSRSCTSRDPSCALHALLNIVNPTCSTWPSEYCTLVMHSTALHSNTITLRLAHLMDNVYNGTIEFRDPQNDIPDLLRGQVRAYGWLVLLQAENSCWIRTISWIISSQLSFFSFETSVLMEGPSLSATASSVSITGKVRRMVTRTASKFGNSQQRFSQIACLPASIATPVLCLDFCPYPHLLSSIRNLQTSLGRNASAILEFTTPGHSVSLLSHAFILSTIPFLPRKHSRIHQGDQPVELQRTSAPLLTSLHRTIGLLTTGPSPLTIESAKNISEEYASTLDAHQDKLLKDQEVRAVFVGKWGMKGWREEAFLTAWESGLLKAGYLTRWAVIVRNSTQ